MHYVLIYNWKCPENDWFKNKLIEKGNKVEVIDNSDDGEIRYKKWHRAINFVECLFMAKKAVDMSEDYTIISMCATPGIIASIIDKKQHKIVALNLLCHSFNKPTMAQKIRDWFYRMAFKNPNLYSTCNEETNRLDYIKRFDVKNDERIIILEDAISMENIEENDVAGEGIFAGGASARDWETLLRCAENTSEFKYQICAREADWPTKVKLSNVNVAFNLPKNEFDRLLINSKMVVLPVNSDVTAGLLVLFEAVKNNKLIVCTDTKSIRKFIPEKYAEMILYEMFNEKEMEQKIRVLMAMSEADVKRLLNDLKKYVYEKYSTDAYMNKFESWIKRGVDK